MEPNIIDFYNETPHGVNVIDKLNEEYDELQKKYDELKDKYFHYVKKHAIQQTIRRESWVHKDGGEATGPSVASSSSSSNSVA